MKTVYVITLKHQDGKMEVVNVLIAGKVRDAMAAAEAAHPGAEAISGNPLGPVHLEA